MKYFGSILSVADISPKNAHGWGLNLKKGSILSRIVDVVGVPHTGSRIRNKIVLEILRSKKSVNSIIDVGGGIGLTGFYLNQFGYKYFSLDKSAYKIKLAFNLLKKSGKTNISFVRADMFKNIPTKKRFDCALNMEVLEHVKDPKEMIKRIVSFVKKGGYIILSFPSTYSINGISQDYFGHVRPGYEPHEIGGFLNKRNVKIQKVYSFGNGFLSKIGFYIDYLLIRNAPILSGLFFWLFYPIVVLDHKFIKSSSPMGYVLLLKKLK